MCFSDIFSPSSFFLARLYPYLSLPPFTFPSFILTHVSYFQQFTVLPSVHHSSLYPVFIRLFHQYPVPFLSLVVSSIHSSMDGWSSIRPFNFRPYSLFVPLPFLLSLHTSIGTNETIPGTEHPRWRHNLKKYYQIFMLILFKI